MRTQANCLLDRLVRPTVRVGGKDLAAFQLCGCVGLELAVLLAMSLVLSRGLSPWPMGAIIGVAIATFYALAFATKIITGKEELIYYHHEIGVLTSAALTAWLLRQPVLAYLDATILGVGAFLTFGRLGCLMAGCCHGRPHAWGVRYREEHADAGFPRYYVGVRLFPTQAVESLGAASIVIVGAAMVLRGAPPGAAMVWYVVAYDLLRFCLEFARGDTGRPYHAGFSEAQWISLALTWVVALGGLVGLLPGQPWHLPAALALAAAMLLVAALRRRPGGRHRLHLPTHVREVAAAIAPRPGDAGAPRVVTTSLGYRISAGVVESHGGAVRHYTLSRDGGPLAAPALASLAKIIAGLKPDDGPFEVLRGQRGAVHLVTAHGAPSVMAEAAPVATEPILLPLGPSAERL
jgi:prolipoprotein diacylglyceryltransferase